MQCDCNLKNLKAMSYLLHLRRREHLLYLEQLEAFLLQPQKLLNYPAMVPVVTRGGRVDQGSGMGGAGLQIASRME